MKSLSGSQLEKPAFFFGDIIMLDDDFSVGGGERWLYEAKGERHFLPPVSQLPSLAYLQNLSVPRRSYCELIRSTPGVTLCQLEGVYIPPPCTEEVLGLFSGYNQNGYPWAKPPCPAKIFAEQYLKFGGEYPSRCRTDGLVSSSKEKLWSQMVTHASSSFQICLSSKIGSCSSFWKTQSPS